MREQSRQTVSCTLSVVPLPPASLPFVLTQAWENVSGSSQGNLYKKISGSGVRMQIFATCVFDFGIQADGEAHFHIVYSQNLAVPGGAQRGIRKVRDAKTQVSVMGVPQAHLGGHAFHTYRSAAMDRNLNLDFDYSFVAGSATSASELPC